MLTRPDRSVNLQVFGRDATEPRRLVLFRDWLRAHPEDRDAYGELKTRLAEQGFERVMDYNNHKAALVYDIYEGDVAMGVGDALSTAGGGLEVYALASAGATVGGVSAMSAGLLRRVVDTIQRYRDVLGTDELVEAR